MQKDVSGYKSSRSSCVVHWFNLITKCVYGFRIEEGRNVQIPDMPRTKPPKFDFVCLLLREWGRARSDGFIVYLQQFVPTAWWQRAKHTDPWWGSLALSLLPSTFIPNFFFVASFPPSLILSSHFFYLLPLESLPSHFLTHFPFFVFFPSPSQPGFFCISAAHIVFPPSQSSTFFLWHFCQFLLPFSLPNPPSHVPASAASSCLFILLFPQKTLLSLSPLTPQRLSLLLPRFFFGTTGSFCLLSWNTLPHGGLSALCPHALLSPSSPVAQHWSKHSGCAPRPAEAFVTGSVHYWEGADH